MIHRGVEKRVGEVVGAHLACESLPRTQASTHFFEDIVPALFLNRNDVVLAEEEAELLDGDPLFVLPIDHFVYDKVVLVETLDLRALGGVKDILERERVEAKMVPDFAQEVHVAEAVDIDPVHLVGFEVRHQVLEGFELPLIHRVAVVANEGKDRGFPILAHPGSRVAGAVPGTWYLMRIIRRLSRRVS